MLISVAEIFPISYLYFLCDLEILYGFFAEQGNNINNFCLDLCGTYSEETFLVHSLIIGSDLTERELEKKILETEKAFSQSTYL